MGSKFDIWQKRSNKDPKNVFDVSHIIRANRNFTSADGLNYGNHGLNDACETILQAIEQEKRIALYADYDVDGTMSCVSWMWFFNAIGFRNYLHYIPCRMSEGYGLNMKAIQHLVQNENADVIITMDTGITANEEAAYCKAHGVQFICTDHHKIQPDKMPDSIIVNPKLHPDENYQELCGCGITFVLLRQLGVHFNIPNAVWTDILALTGIATICDIVPLNQVNHKLVQLGVKALLSSKRPILTKLREACALEEGLDEKDVGFRVGPRINAVGRLQHADSIIRAFTDDDPEGLIQNMESCNEERKRIQGTIYEQACALALDYLDEPILFLGGPWHEGVVGIAASKIVEKHWKPTWLFKIAPEGCKGSARSIPGFDVTDAMSFAGKHFKKFGGHRAAGGFTFDPSKVEIIRELLTEYALQKQTETPHLWSSKIEYDCELPSSLMNLKLVDTLEDLKPFGHGFEEPRFVVAGNVKQIQFYNDKVTGQPKHTAIFLTGEHGNSQKIMFFNETLTQLRTHSMARFLVSLSKNRFAGKTSLNVIAHDWEIADL
ncbi:MAG: DHH family phosphoesterase [Oligoflexales bacterium]